MRNGLYIVFLVLLIVLIVGREILGGVRPMSVEEFIDWIMPK